MRLFSSNSATTFAAAALCSVAALGCNVIFGITPGESASGTTASGGTGGTTSPPGGGGSGTTTTPTGGGGTGGTTMPTGGGGTGGATAGGGGTGGTTMPTGGGGTGGATTGGGGAGGALEEIGEWAFASVNKGNGRAGGHDIALGDGQDLYVCGLYQNDVTLDNSGAQTSADGEFVTDVRTDGSAPWAAPVDMDGNAHAVATGGGMLFVGGSFLGSTTIGSLIDTGAATFRKAFLARLDPGTGAGIWARVFVQPGTPDDGRSKVMRAAVSNNVVGCPGGATASVIVLVASDGTIDFGDGPHLESSDALIAVAKLDDQGNLCWAHHFAAGYAGMPGILGGVDFDGDDAQFGAFHAALAVDDDGNVYVAGAMGLGINMARPMHYCQTANLCEPGVSSAAIGAQGGADAFAVKLLPNGHTKWGQRYHGVGSGAAEGNQYVDAATARGGDAGGILLLGGGFDRSLQAGGADVLQAPGGDPGDGFLLTIDSTNGNVVWGRRVGDAGLQRVLGVAINPSQWPVVAAVTIDDPASAGVSAFGPDGQADSNCPPLAGVDPAAKTSDIVVMAFQDSSAQCQFARRFGDAGPQVPASLAVDGFGFMYVTGTFSGTLDFGGNASPLTAEANNPQVFTACVHRPMQ